MAEQTCPSCGGPLPSEMAQHAENLEIGLVTCPQCGSRVTLDKGPNEPAADFEQASAAPPGHTEGGETFSGQETAAGVADELSKKPT